MQIDEETAKIMEQYKPGSGRFALVGSGQGQEFEAVSDDDEQEEIKEETQQPSPTQPLSSSEVAGVVGVLASTPPQVQVEAKRPVGDKEALEVVSARFADLWKLEIDHAELKGNYKKLEQAKAEVEKERDEWHNKSDAGDAKIGELNKALEAEKERYKALEKQLKEQQDGNAKLTHRLEGEKERYTLLSGQFEELNAKLVEICSNVTHMKTDVVPALRSPRRASVDISNKPAPSTGISSFFTTPTKPPAGGRK